MIVYNTKKWWGFVVLCSMRGSVFPRVVPYALISGLIATLIKLDNRNGWEVFDSLGHRLREDSLFDHPYSLHIWGMSLGFLLVFRGNLAYARYWEGRRELARMASYWQDAAMMAVLFDEKNKNINQYREWKQLILHQVSLLHALSIQCLRLDDDLENLVVFNRLEGYEFAAPAAVPASSAAPTQADAHAGTTGTDTSPGHQQNAATAMESATGRARRKKRETGRRYSVNARNLVESLKGGLTEPVTAGRKRTLSVRRLRKTAAPRWVLFAAFCCPHHAIAHSIAVNIDMSPTLGHAG